MIGGGRGLHQRIGRIAAATLLAAGLALAAHAEEGDAPTTEPLKPFKLPNTQFEPITWATLEGWAEDDQAAAFSTFLTSCKAILRGDGSGRPMYEALHSVCERAVAARPSTAAESRAFFEANFRPFRIAPLGSTDGFTTGYYEPIVEGARARDDTYAYPLYRKPASLVFGRARTVKVKGKRVRRGRGAFLERAAIDNGALAGRNLEICYLKDPIDAFFVEIQGSARVRLNDGSLMRVNYAAQNGHKYTAVGKFLIDRNIYTREEMSMQKIREWMTANPEEGRKLRHLNKSFVFFRETSLGDTDEPIGAQGVSLTPGRSIAVDRRLHVFGTPFFIAGDFPIETERSETPFHRLMIAQDTGGAIIGPARADIYFGAGQEAENVAGRMKNPAKFVMLVPSELDPVLQQPKVPLPLPRPAAIANAPASARTASAATPALAAVETKPAAIVAPANGRKAEKPEKKKPEAEKRDTKKPAARLARTAHVTARPAKPQRNAETPLDWLKRKFSGDTPKKPGVRRGDAKKSKHGT